MIGPKVQVLNSCGPRLVSELFLLLSFDFMASVFGISPLRVGRSFCHIHTGNIATKTATTRKWLGFAGFIVHGDLFCFVLWSLFRLTLSELVTFEI